MAGEADPAKDLADRLKAIRNERAKLMATYFNGLAIAVVVVGAFSPAFAAKTSGTAGGGPLTAQTVQLAFCLAASATLHILGRLSLGAIR